MRGRFCVIFPFGTVIEGWNRLIYPDRVKYCVNDRQAGMIVPFGKPEARLSYLETLSARPHGGGAELVATVPPGLGPWPHLASFDLTIVRRYAFGGRRRSFINASCPLPPRFTAGLFPLARATYRLVDGRSLTATIVRGCRVRE